MVYLSKYTVEVSRVTGLWLGSTRCTGVKREQMTVHHKVLYLRIKQSDKWATSRKFMKGRLNTVTLTLISLKT